MVKLVMCVTRKKELSREEFQHYWLNHHGPLIKKFSSTYKIKKYVQCHTINDVLNQNVRTSREMQELEYDGIAELWWESESEFISAISSEEGQKLRTTFLDDEAKFIDFSKSTAFFTKEETIIE